MNLIARMLILTLVAAPALADREAPFESNPSDTVVFTQSLSVLETADFNSDGIADLVVKTGGDNELYILLGQPGGKLGAAKKLELPRNYIPGTLKFGDANGDGHIDIVTGSGTDIVAFLGDGEGGFKTQYSYRVGEDGHLKRMDATLLALGDLNGDGRDDVIAIGHPKQPAIAVSLANEDGTYQRPQHFAAERPFGSYPAFAVADINRDGNLDVVAADLSWLVAYTGNGDGTLNREQGIQRLSNTGRPIRIRNGDNGRLSAVDSDADGFPDRVRLINRSSMFEFSINDEGPLFLEASGQYFHAFGVAPEPVDLDSDGVMDFVLGHAVPDRSMTYTPGPAVGWGRESERGVAMPPVLQQVPTGHTRVVDIDLDGKLDAVIGLKYPADSVETKFTDTGPGFIHVFLGRLENAPSVAAKPKTLPPEMAPRSTETVVAAPAPAAPTPVKKAPITASAPVVVDELVGCWKWSNGATITVSAAGMAANGVSEGRWAALENRNYRITWPDIVSAVTIDASGATMSEKTLFSSGTGKRIGAPSDSFAGTWQLHNGATAVAADGSYTIAHLKGSWRKSTGDRRYEILWPLVDSVVLDQNGKRLSGLNQFGRFSAIKAASCDY